jgi:hypothetical protein
VLEPQASPAVGWTSARGRDRRPSQLKARLEALLEGAAKHGAVGFVFVQPGSIAQLALAVAPNCVGPAGTPQEPQGPTERFEMTSSSGSSISRTRGSPPPRPGTGPPIPHGPLRP